MAKHTRYFTIEPNEVDKNQFILIDALQKRIQTISDEHGYLLGFGFDDMNKIGLFWVVSRLLVEIKKRPLLHQKVRIDTWLTPPTGAGILRYYQLFSTANELLIEGVAKWSLVSRETLKLVKIKSYDFIYNLTFDEIAIDFPYETLKKMDTFKSGHTTKSVFHTVTKEELDFNLHVNNTVYIKYLVDLFQIDQVITKYQINYLQPLYEFDQLRIDLFAFDDTYQFNAFVIKENNQEVLSFQASIVF